MDMESARYVNTHLCCKNVSYRDRSMLRSVPQHVTLCASLQEGMRGEQDGLDRQTGDEKDDDKW